MVYRFPRLFFWTVLLPWLAACSIERKKSADAFAYGGNDRARQRILAARDALVSAIDKIGAGVVPQASLGTDTTANAEPALATYFFPDGFRRTAVVDFLKNADERAVLRQNLVDLKFSVVKDLKSDAGGALRGRAPNCKSSGEKEFDEATALSESLLALMELVAHETGHGMKEGADCIGDAKTIAIENGATLLGGPYLSAIGAGIAAVGYSYLPEVRGALALPAEPHSTWFFSKNESSLWRAISPLALRPLKLTVLVSKISTVSGYRAIRLRMMVGGTNYDIDCTARATQICDGKLFVIRNDESRQFDIDLDSLKHIPFRYMFSNNQRLRAELAIHNGLGWVSDTSSTLAYFLHYAGTNPPESKPEEQPENWWPFP